MGFSMGFQWWGFIVTIWVVGSSLPLPLELWRSNRMRPVSAAQNGRPAPGRPERCGVGAKRLKKNAKFFACRVGICSIMNHDASCTLERFLSYVVMIDVRWIVLMVCDGFGLVPRFLERMSGCVLKLIRRVNASRILLFSPVHPTHITSP